MRNCASRARSKALRCTNRPRLCLRIELGPVLLLAAGVVLLVMGFWRHVDSVAAIGAIGIVASLVLPPMQGAFEIGSASATTIEA